MDNGDYPETCPHVIEREVMRMWWRNLTFIHWPIEPAEVQRRLPASLTVDTYDGAAWVGLVPFEMTVAFPGGRVIPGAGRFPETNIRTYVRGPDGTPGVWFDSLEAGDPLATATARLTYGLPYFWADMAASRAGDISTYRSRRRRPGPVGTSSSAAVRSTAAIDTHSPLDRFLTARWGLYSTFRDRVLYAPVSHARWDLHRAELLHLDDELMSAAGYRTPADPPLVHWTGGVEVRIGRPRRP